MSISDTLRRAIADSRETPYRIAKEAGLSQAVLSRFIREQRALNMENLEKLAAYFGLSLKPDSVPRKPGGKKKPK